MDHAQRLHDGFMTTGLAFAGAMAVSHAASRAARDEARQAVHTVATGTVARWQAYARRLERELAESRARENQLTRDLADAMDVITSLEH